MHVIKVRVDDSDSVDSHTDLYKVSVVFFFFLAQLFLNTPYKMPFGYVD